MNQILDHSGPKIQKIHRNPGDTARIIKVYAILIIIFALCFIGKSAYTLSENKKIIDLQKAIAESTLPRIELQANNDILTINVNYKDAIEEVIYQWYRGDATLDDIHSYVTSQGTSQEDNETDDEEVFVDENEIVALGEANNEKGNGKTQMSITNIGIPKGESTIHIRVRTRGNATETEYVQHYSTDVGVDKIEPKINVTLQGKKLLITAADETEIDYLTYSINDEQEVQIKERKDKKTIETEIELSETEDTVLKICAVDKAKNSEIYDKTYALYVSKPKIEFLAESDFSKIYITVTYPKGLKKVEYDLNGKTYEEEYENPEDARKVELEVPTDVGYNIITVKAYTEEEQVYAEETGECEYNP